MKFAQVISTSSPDLLGFSEFPSDVWDEKRFTSSPVVSKLIVQIE